METSMEKISAGNQKPEGQALGCLVHIYWMAIGNVALFFSAMLIARDGGITLSILDAVYWAVILSLLAVRYLDIRHFKGDTANGVPATMRDYRTYAWMTLALGTVIWLAAHATTYFFKS
jgi:hypothetical protein